MWAIGVIQPERPRTESLRNFYFIVAAVLTTLMIGLRLDVGGDRAAYQRIYNDIYFLTLPSSLSITDAGYAFTNWLSAQADLGVTFVNLVCAIFFFGGFGYLCWRQPNPFLAVLVGVPYLIIVVAMGYTRQGAAIGIVCFAIADASERRIMRLVMFIGIAALMHKTALLMLPVALYPVFRRNLLLGGIGFALFAGLFVVVLRSSADALVTSYVQSNIDSQGAFVRVTMNVIAAAAFLWLRNRIDLPQFQKTFWTVCSIVAIASLAALFVAPSSSGIDRLALYLIPLQVVTLSRIPYVLSGNTNRGLPSVILGTIIYTFAVQFVWLNFGTFSQYWLPYRNVIYSEPL